MISADMLDDAPVTASNALAIRKSLEKINDAVSEFEKIEAGFENLERDHPSNLACNVTTPAGMREAIAGRAAWREPRIATEKARKAGKAPVLALGKDIDARATMLTARLEAGEANYDDQIKVEERRKAAEAEEKRLAEVTRRERNSAALAAIRQRAFDVEVVGTSASDVSRSIVALHTDEQNGFGIDEDFKALQKIAVDETRARLRGLHQALIEREAEDAARKAEAEALAKERAELARLRAEQEARDKAARDELAAQQRAADEERAKADAEARALRDAEEARQRQERAEQQAELDAERAEMRKVQDETDRTARVAELAQEKREAEERAAAALAHEKVEAAERKARYEAELAKQQQIAAEALAAREKAEAEHYAEAKGRNAWRALGAVCESILIPGAKLSDLRLSARAALDKAGL